MREKHHRATFSACHLPPSTILVTVEGDIDATNGRSLAVYIERHVVDSTRLVLDLKPVDFFGTAGFAALLNVNVVCSRYGVDWAILVGPQVHRLLRICDPEFTLPLADPQSGVEDLYASPGDRKLLVGR
ncbi:MAG TPA: STAS domain-containing protein, partial [Mycobacterium sp.]|nr:STAS domain-containing protein [Mycobacterium sp.]